MKAVPYCIVIVECKQYIQKINISLQSYQQVPESTNLVGVYGIYSFAN